MNFPPGMPTGVSMPSFDSDGAFEVSWGSAEDATGYVIEIAKDEMFTDVVKSEETSALTYDVILNEEGKYWVRVKAKEGELLESEWSEAKAIKIEFPVEPVEEKDPVIPPLDEEDKNKIGCFISELSPL
ncbi:MAG: hypothetical protein JSV34_03050 [Candidatus Omnitrophota bacterium]|nr:MAG: hypothetical protein JSV34_03050 [Candidatus Omnitrophota bacterium]